MEKNKLISVNLAQFVHDWCDIILNARSFTR